MQKTIEIDISSDEEQLSPKPTEEIVKEYKIRKLVEKPKKRILTKAQLETSRKNLEKARNARLLKAKGKGKEEKRNPNIVEEYESDSDSSSDSDEPVPVPVAKEEKPVKNKKKLLDKIDKLESLINKMSQKNKKSVHKTIIMQGNGPTPQQNGGNQQANGIKKQLMLDLF